jgi:hypothetical protein
MHLQQEVEERLKENARRFIEAEEPERITVQLLYGEGWDHLHDVAQIGREFRVLVNAGDIPGLRSLPRNEWRNQRNHVEYARDA